VVTLMELVASARSGALTSEKVDHLLTARMREDLDALLVADPAVGTTRLAWLTTPAVEASAAAVKLAIDKLLFLRGMDAHLLDVSMLPRERRRFLATLGRRSTVQGLRRREERRFPILLALVAQSAVDQLDEAISLFDQAVSARESRAKAKTNEALAERAKKGEARQLLMDVILPVLADPSIPDEDVGGILRERVGMQTLREVSARSSTASAAGRFPPVRRPRSCPPGTPITWPRPAVTGTTPRSATTGSCAPSWRCATGSAPAMCSYPGPAATPTPAPTCSPPRAVAGPAGRVLPARPQARRSGRGDRASEAGAAPGARRLGGDPGRFLARRCRRGPAGRARPAGDPAAVGRGRPRRGQGAAR
jgi:hypothetical protein